MKSIGFIGLGKMGHPMASHLIDQYDLHLYNRTKSKAEDLIQSGGIWHNSPGSLAAKSKIIVVMVTDDQACNDVFYGNKGIFTADTPGIIINMSTITPEKSIELATSAKNDGWDYVEAPVSGTVSPAEEGTLTIIAAPSGSLLDEIRPILQNFGNEIYEFSNIGQASQTKLLINLNLAVQTAIFSETMNISEELGLDPSKILKIINNSAVSTIISKVKGENMIKGEFPTAFPYIHMLKDLRYGINLGDRVNSPMPLSNLTKEIFLMGNDLEELDFSAIFDVYKNM